MIQRLAWLTTLMAGVVAGAIGCSDDTSSNTGNGSTAGQSGSTNGTPADETGGVGAEGDHTGGVGASGEAGASETGGRRPTDGAAGSSVNAGAGGGGGEDAGTGASAGNGASSGTGASAGNRASSGTGATGGNGADTGGSGSGLGGSSQGGASPGGSSGMSPGGTAGTDSGGSTGVGGTGGLGETGGSAGTGDPGEAIVDPDTPGTGVCSNETAGTILAAIWQIWPELADITVIYDSNAGLIGDGSFVHIFQSGDGFRLVLVRGSGDCPAGCIDHEYWYFETDASCDPTQVGHYSRIFDSSGNCYRIEGNALWGLPEPSDAGRCPDVDLSALNTECADGTCPAGLTPVSFYGIAGEAGPLFCWCTIVCADNPSACPSGTTCQMIADGPGLVCYA